MYEAPGSSYEGLPVRFLGFGPKISTFSAVFGPYERQVSLEGSASAENA